MPVPGRTTPCEHCPWRTSSMRGYLGADSAEHFYFASITAEGEMPCHEQVNYDDEDWQDTQLPDVDYCAGYLIYFRNHLKMPRRPSLLEAMERVKRSAAVFSWPEEYMRHHLPGASDADIKEAVRKATTYCPE
jgi:hypothetical protein